VAVVGGGAMGAATAWFAARRGASVVLLEQFAAGHDRGSSHGSSRIFRLAYRDPAYVALARRALPLWRELEDEAQVSLLVQTGGLDSGPRELVDEIGAALTAAGLPWEPVPRQAAAERWPGLRVDEAALFQPDAGRVDADATVRALHRRAAELGADLRTGTRVSAVRATADGAAVLTDDGAIEASSVVLAAGAWLPGLVADLPFACKLPPFRVTQEQPAYFATRDDTTWPSFLHHRPTGQSDTLPTLGFGYYGLFTPGHGVKVGAHATGPEVEPDARQPADHELLSRLARYVEDWLPGVDPTPVAVETCLYTSTPDEEFVLERFDRIVVCSPCSGHGFKFVPAIGERVAGLALAR
jgi:sarcosine oxidase